MEVLDDRIVSFIHKMWMRLFTKAVTKDMKLKLIRSKVDPCMFYKETYGEIDLIVIVYIDDTIVTGDGQRCEEFIQEFGTKFTIKVQSPMIKHLGVKYIRGKDVQGFYLKASMNEMAEQIVKEYEEINHWLRKKINQKVQELTFSRMKGKS